MTLIPIARLALVLTALFALTTSSLAQGYHGADRIGQVTFLSEPGIGYTILSDCTIEVQGRRVAQVRASYDRGFSWYYYIPLTGQRYGVDHRGSVWRYSYGRWNVIGHAVWSRSC